MKHLLSIAVCIALLASVILAALPFAAMAETKAYSGNVYYVDADNGSDSNNGLSESNALKSIDKVNMLDLKAGDAVLLKKGCVWSTGWFWPKGSGTESAPITISSYGEGAKPAIVSNFVRPMESDKPSVDATFYLANQSYVVVDGLDLTNATNSTAKQYVVRILTRDAYYTKGCVIKNCTIAGSSKYSWSAETQKDLSGIDCSAENYWSFISSLNIENNEIYNVKGIGINVNGAYSGCNSSGKINDKYSAKKVYIAGNYLQNIGKDGILTNNCIEPIVEYNTCNKSHSYATTSYHVAMWPFACYGALFQFNESYNTQTTKDGQGFDCDYQCYYTTFQYNYSHDNQGGFMLICTEPKNWDGGVAFNYGVKVRYNISENDMKSVVNLFCHITDTQFYNNTIVNYKYNLENVISTGSRDNVVYPINTSFKNNIFYTNSGKVNFSNSQGTVFENNVVYGANRLSYPKNDNEGGSSDNVTANNNIYADPMLVVGTNPNGGIENCDVYKLAEGSPALNSGVAIAENGGRDFFGNAVGEGACNIGAYNGPAVKAEDITTNAGRTTLVRTDPVTKRATTVPTTVAPIVYGDANGDGVVDSKDVLIVRKYLAKWNVTIHEKEADTNADGKVDAKDVLRIRKYLSKIIETLGPNA